MIYLKLNSVFKTSLLITCVLLIFQCKKDGDQPENGQVNFEITDSPIDNTEVQGAFVTISAIKMDGKTIELENKQTINVLAYQNGNTKSLKVADLEAGFYSNISLVLDFATDANGNEPGCYVLTTDNKKHDLNINGTNSNEINTTSGVLEVAQNSQTDLLIDFDLRKSIKDNGNNAESGYAFVTDAEMEVALRTIIRTETGTIEGNCANTELYSDRTVVYAYKKGTFTKAVETEGQGNSNIEFSNAVTSAVVASNGDFSLHFLEAGEYEIHFAAYEDSDNNGEFELKGMLTTSIIGSLDLLSLSVGAQAAISLDILATGLTL